MGDVGWMQVVDLAAQFVAVLACDQILHHLMAAHLGLVHQAAHQVLLVEQRADTRQAVVHIRRGWLCHAEGVIGLNVRDSNRKGPA
jgi:hypothetical protein